MPRVGSGQDVVLKISPVGSGQVRSGQVRSGRVGWGQDLFEAHGSGQVRSRGDTKLTGLVRHIYYAPRNTGHSWVGTA